MSGIGSSEFILLLVIGLIVLGPKRLPEIANKIGSWIGQARRMTRVMKRQLEEELNFDQHKTLLPPTPPFAATKTDTTPEPAPPPTAAETDPELNPELPPEHIPNDDDTYSPLHDEPAAAAPDGDAPDEVERGKEADR